jgi:hypothetical protein
MGFWIGGEAGQPQGVPVQTGILTCQDQSRDTPGLVNKRSNMLLQLYPTLSFSLILITDDEVWNPACSHSLMP